VGKLSKRQTRRILETEGMRIERPDPPTVIEEKEIVAPKSPRVPRKSLPKKEAAKVLPAVSPVTALKKRWKFTIHRDFEDFIDHIIAEEV